MNKKVRQQFKHQNRVVYEWEQGLDSLTLYITCPPLPAGIKKGSLFQIKIKSHSLSVGIKGNPPYLVHDFKGVADSEQCCWYLEKNPQTKEDQILIEILKAQKGVRWGSVFKGHESLNPIEQEDLKKKLMLERFQQEHPGFDFSDAEFNGQVPEARSFMGGMKNT